MKSFRNSIFSALAIPVILLWMTACSNGTTTTADDADRPAGWSVESHSNAVDPNYDIVFPDDKVNQITITITPEDWEAMQANMVALFGEAGTGAAGKDVPGGGGGIRPGGGEVPEDSGPPEGFTRPEGGEPPEGFEPPVDGERPGMPEEAFPGPGRGLGGGDMTPENPMWVSATIEFDGKTWTNVGVRYKGNSSLTSGWRSGTLKMPLKLDFDEFEDEYPEIENQRFYGFKQLSLANGFNDTSFLHDAVASQILKEAGLPAAETAFYEVFLDYGEGPVSLGLYTMIEVVDDTVIPTYFGSDEGNIYEAEGSAASFAASTYDLIEDSFQKENNSDEADWSDIEELFDVLHSDLRTSDPSAWRDKLESIFDVDGFLEWLAISAIIQHWDAYGSMSHNYYLYHDPDTGKLTWISWDHNEILSTRGGGGGFGGRSVTLDKNNVGENWPLIRFLLDDPVYYDLYLNFLEETIEGAFNPEHMAETYRTMADLIAPYAVEEVGETVFESAVQQLIDFTWQQAAAVEEFLQSQGY